MAPPRCIWLPEEELDSEGRPRPSIWRLPDGFNMEEFRAANYNVQAYHGQLIARARGRATAQEMSTISSLSADQTGNLADADENTRAAQDVPQESSALEADQEIQTTGSVDPPTGTMAPTSVNPIGAHVLPDDSSTHTPDQSDLGAIRLGSVSPVHQGDDESLVTMPRRATHVNANMSTTLSDMSTMYHGQSGHNTGCNVSSLAPQGYAPYQGRSTFNVHVPAFQPQAYGTNHGYTQLMAPAPQLPAPFFPMRNKLQPPQLPGGYNMPQSSQQPAAPGFSPNYLGDTSLERNQSANIPDFLNTALFITGLPQQITVHDLLSTIRNTGRVYAVHINDPEPIKDHWTCAAKVIFYERRAAAAFFNSHRGGLHIPGYPNRAKIRWNRVKSAEADMPPHYTSRVLMIAGPPQIVNPDALTTYFRPRFDFDVDEILEHGPSNVGGAVVEYRFGSFRCQAESAKIALSRELGAVVTVWFGQDPCDVPTGMAYQ